MPYTRRPLVPIRHIKYCKRFQFLSWQNFKLGLVQIPLWIDGMVPNPNFCTIMMIFLPIAYYGLICFFLTYSKSKLKPKINVPWIEWVIMSSQTSHLTSGWMNFFHFIYICFIHVLNAWHLCAKNYEPIKNELHTFSFTKIIAWIFLWNLENFVLNFNVFLISSWI